MKTATRVIVVLFLASLPLRLMSGAQDSSSAPVHQIEVTAKTFEFVPNEVHVKAGERVAITLRSVDRAHGLKLSLYPEGTSESGEPGLVFDQPQGDAKVEKHKEQVITFLAARAGTYDFECSVKCSMGHGHDRMTGKLIVEE